jgi:hypothetical protein
MPEPSDNLHPRIKAWLVQHKREQDDRARELKKHRNEPFYWGKGLLLDLTKRDLYRFSATSEIFKAVETAGGKVADSPISGKAIFLACGEKVECSIVEKMFKPIKLDETKWTAYPEHHQTGLQWSGFLRVTINTYIGRKAPQWIETRDTKVADLLQEIAGAVISAGQILVQLRQEREEAERRRREEEARRQELQHARQIDDERWARLSRRADDWERRARLLAFVAEIKKRVAVEGDAEIAGHTLDEWVLWADARIATLDPFSRGISELFESVLAPSQPPR